MAILFVILCLSLVPLSIDAQHVGSRKFTQETETWLRSIAEAAAESKPYYSQFDQYPARKQGSLESDYVKKTGVDLYVYGLDFYYASGSWFSPDYIRRCRNNLISIVKAAWKENKAIPCFSWHLENPYVPSDFDNYMGCRYRYSVDGYPMNHRYVIKEILENEGDSCGFGSYKGKDKYAGYRNPAQWFDARCREVAEIIKDMKDENGEPIPIIFRLWHEFEDDWQWWGRNSVSQEDYIRFFRLTVDKMEKYTQTHNIIYAFCPDRFWNSEEKFMLCYPGDEYVDMLGFDDYSIGTTMEALQATINRAKIVFQIADKHNKIAALFESANKEKKTADRYFRDFLRRIVQSDSVKLGLVQMWSTGHFSTPEEIADRKNFLRSGIVRVLKR